MKEGDIVVCIKDYAYVSKLFNGKDANIYSYTTNRQYKILTIGKDGKYFYIEADIKIESNNKGLRFSTKEELVNVKKFGNYFITLADWREQQINNILND